jgi:putative peptidoglycan lipid II flippase
VSVAQISLLINTQIATHVGVGAVSWLTYADRLMEFPTALLGVALGVVLLPQLSAARPGDDDTYSGLLDWGLRLVLLLACPARWRCWCSAPMVAVLFHYGAFDARDVQRPWRRCGLWRGAAGHGGVKVLAPGFYARQDMRTPGAHRHRRAGADPVDEPGLRALAGRAGLALSIGLGALVNAGCCCAGCCAGAL